MRLLIVDDHDINLKLLRAQLEAESNEVVQACDGVEALELLEREPVDGVISDILMPRMDGYRLCMEVRSRSALAHLPFVLYTSTYNSPGDRALAESLGADAYIPKPAPTARILDAIRAASGRSSLRAPAALDEPEPLMKQYNEVLIRKLEEKGAELERTHWGLLESQARLAGLISSAMDAIVAVDEGHSIVLFNDAAGQMFRIEPELAIGRPLNEFIPSRLHELHDRHLEQFARQAGSAKAMGPREVNARRADGSEFPIEANISCLSTSRGLLLTAVIRDVTERRQAQAALRESEAGLRRAQDVARMAHAITSRDGSIVSSSTTLDGIFGLPPGESPQHREQWLQHVHEDDRASLLRAAARARELRTRVDCEYRLRRGDGWSRIRHILEPLDDRDFDQTQLIFNTVQDITAEHQAQEKIRELNHVYAVLSAINSLIVRASDRDELFAQACRILVETGRFAKAWIGMVDEGIDPVRILAWAGAPDAYFEDLQQRLRNPQTAKAGVLAKVLAEGKPVVCNDVANDPTVVERQKLVASGSRSLALLPLIVGGRTVGVLSIHSPIVGFFDGEESELLLGLASDISFALVHLLQADRISYLANHDALTGLANRGLYSELLSQQLAEPERDNRLACVALLDLVRFRRVNETLGRHCADDLLMQVAARLRSIDPFVARIGADLFAMQFNDCRSAAELAREFEHVASRCFGPPFQVCGEEIRMGCRIGAAVYPGDGDDAETLLHNAESALRAARSSVEGFTFYAPAMNASATEALAMESKLRRAIEREEFVLHYQPKVRIDDRSICGVEALIRWQDPERGLVPPMKFIPVLEETGLIGAVGKWALRRALDDYQAWRDAGAPHVRVAVNVSPLQLNQPNFVEALAELLRGGDGHGGGDRLELEITESVIMDDVDRKIEMLSEIRTLGVSIAVDDFGTGYSSLSYISRLPISCLKIDRAFVAAMDSGPDGLTLVTSIIALAHALKLKVVAEGVETEQQAQLLAAAACEEGQGYLFSRPVPGEKILEMLLAGKPLP